jgi:hypothetical protein
VACYRANFQFCTFIIIIIIIIIVVVVVSHAFVSYENIAYVSFCTTTLEITVLFISTSSVVAQLVYRSVISVIELSYALPTFIVAQY